MKLRNKKTGKVANVIFYSPIGNFNLRLMEDADYLDVTCTDKYLGVYKTLAELNEEWEDVPEPLIKDEKIRKAVRTWAEANNVSRVSCDSCVAHKKYLLRFSATELFNEPIIELYSESEESLWDNEHYTISELCGEEEE